MEDSNCIKINEIISKNVLMRLEELNISAKNLSARSDIPYESIKKLINGSTVNPSLLTCIKVSKALDISLSELVNDKTDEKPHFENLDTNEKNFIQAIAEIEISSGKISDKNSEKSEIPLINCNIDKNGNLIVADTPYETILLSIEFEYVPYLKALRLPDNRYFPVYYKDDILIISEDRFPLSGDAAVFTCDNTLYIEKYVHGSEKPFSSINEAGSHFKGSLNNATVLGYVVTVLRNI